MKKIYLWLFLVVFPIMASAQSEKWTIGGNVGLRFSDYTVVNIAPQVGYNFGRIFTLGAGLSYTYHETAEENRSMQYAGVNVYGRLNPVWFLTLFVQPEMYYRWGRINSGDSKEGSVATTLVGGGFAIPVGLNGKIMAQVYYDVLQKKYSPYGDKIGYSVGYSYSF